MASEGLAFGRTIATEAVPDDGEQHGGCGACETRQASRDHERPLHLFAARLAVQTPLTEVLAVVAEEAIAVLADPRARSTDHFLAVEADALVSSKPESVSASETSDRNLFHRSPVEGMYEGTVMNDLAAADVNAVVRIPKPRRNEV